MKCPKCGFNSFEYYDSCKKCSSDLTGYKQTYSITSIVLPSEAKEKLAVEFQSAEDKADHSGGSAETHDDIFSFNLPDAPPFVPDHSNDDPFNFDEPHSDTKKSGNLKSNDDVFADLLESTSQVKEPSIAVGKSVESSSGPGEFDLESFSWDDTSVATEAGAAETADDFDSLFGETKVNTQK